MFAKSLTAAIFALAATQTSAEPWDFHAAPLTKSDELRAIADANPALSIQETEDGAVDSMVMFSDVLFEFGQSDLNPAALVTLQAVAKDLGSVAGLKIIGHTDDIGAADRNHALGLDRAKAVRAWIADQTGLNPDAIAVDSAGETKPIAANQTENGTDNAQGRALNRRVEFKIIEDDTATPPLENAKTGDDIIKDTADRVEEEKISSIHPKQQVI